LFVAKAFLDLCKLKATGEITLLRASSVSIFLMQKGGRTHGKE